jgi:phosphate transport system permease protein
MQGSDSAAQLHQARPISERLIKYVLFGCGAISIATTAGIIFVLFFETVAFFSKVSFGQFFLDTQWTPLFADQQHFGIWPLVGGTLLTSAIAIGTAVPLGLLAALYLSEFAKVRVRRVLKPMLEILAGIPTVVYGYFALTMVTPFLQSFIPGLSGFNALGSGLVMGVMILPIIASLSEDAIYSVPANLREAAYALGATKLSATFQVVLPSAFSGIGASVILGISRALGETMIVAIAAGQEPRFTLDPRVPIATMTAYIAQVSLGDTPSGTLEYQTIFAVGALLFTFTFMLNIVAHRLRRRMTGGNLL